MDSSQLTHEDLTIITQGKTQMANDSTYIWRYESRRQAQPVLDFLYLGPSSITRDRDFLQKEGITMLLAARDSRLAGARLMSAERTAHELGLAVDYIDVSSRQELIRAFPLAVKKINDHLIQRYRSQAVQVPEVIDQVNPGLEGGQVPVVPESRMVINSANFSTGKVLVFCETGNDRSATVVAAYLMSMFNSDLVRTLQFINLQRFCVNFDDETKFLLRSYEDIIAAQRSVNGSMGQTGPAVTTNPTAKRRIAESMDEDEDTQEPEQSGFQFDTDRYIGRDPFAPFVDGDVSIYDYDV